MFLQGNSYSDSYTANFLIGYILSPGSTVYLAYNSNYLDAENDFDTVDEVVFLKVSYKFGL